MKQLDIKKQIRKNQDLLSSCGYGVIIFLLWSFVKLTIYIINLWPDAGQPFDPERKIYIISLISSSSVQLIIGLIAGYLTYKEGKHDKKCGLILRIFSIILVIMGIGFVVGDSYLFVELGEFDVILLVTLIIDLLYLFFCIVVMVSALKLSKLYKLDKEHE